MGNPVESWMKLGVAVLVAGGLAVGLSTSDSSQAKASSATNTRRAGEEWWKGPVQCRYQPFDGLCRVGRVTEEPNPSTSGTIFTVTFVADFMGGSHFDQEFRIPQDDVESFRKYVHRPNNLVLCTGEVLASGTCKPKTRGTAKTLVTFDEEKP